METQALGPAHLTQTAKDPSGKAKAGVSWIALVLPLSFLPLLIAYFSNLWTREAYQFFPLALGGVALLVHRGWEEVPKPVASASGWVVAPLLILAFLMEAIATWLWSPWLGAIASLPMLLGIVLWVGGWPLFRKLLPAGIVLLTIVLPPLKLDEKLTLWLQHLSTIGSSHLLGSLGVKHTLAGNVIEIPGHRLLVEEACSGIKSVLFMSAASLFFSFWRRRTALQVVASLILILGVVMVGNVIRIASGTWLEYYYHINILTGARHETVGVIMLASYLASILVIDWWWSKDSQAKPVAAAAAKKSSSSPSATGGRKSNAPWAWATLLAFAGLGAAEIRQGWKNLHPETEVQQHGAANLAKETPVTLPYFISGWSRLSSADPTMLKVEAFGGITSQVWQFRKDKMLATVSFDYPFMGYHDVRICYLGNGCVESGTGAFSNEGIAGVSPYLQVSMDKQKDKLTLWFSTLDQNGNWLDDSFAKRNILERFRNELGASTTSYRVQMVIASPEALTDAELGKARRLYEDVREQLLPYLLPKKVAVR